MNATCHPSDMQLVCGDIKAIFLPPNVTSLLQPMDQGILNHVKLSYRKKLLRFLIENDSDSIRENLKKITIKDVIYWLAESWQNTNESFLRKSWKKLRPELEFEEAPDPTPVTQQELLNLVQQVPGCENAGEGYLEEWATVDVTEEYSDHDIVGMVQEQRDGDVGGSDSEGDEAPTDVVT
uniref:DDE-1 domain-containing protein n=1 Tax=Cuerna arida TaxID=1464854 RepID=A0A1B6GBH2_9HEMI